MSYWITLLIPSTFHSIYLNIIQGLRHPVVSARMTLTGVTEGVASETLLIICLWETQMK